MRWKFGIEKSALSGWNRTFVDNLLWNLGRLKDYTTIQCNGEIAQNPISSSIKSISNKLRLNKLQGVWDQRGIPFKVGLRPLVLRWIGVV